MRPDVSTDEAELPDQSNSAEQDHRGGEHGSKEGSRRIENHPADQSTNQTNHDERSSGDLQTGSALRAIRSNRE
jgi:hypothetical protein